MVPGGLTSGFFGGLCGHQGALRSLFPLRSGLAKEAIIASGVTIAYLVDLTRLPTYVTRDLVTTAQEQGPLLLASTFAAFIGS